MLSTKEIVWSVLPPYLLLLIGVILRRVGVLKREHDEATMHVAFHVMYPCFLLDKILGSTAVRNLSAVTWPIAIGFLLPVGGIAIGWLFGKFIGLEKGTGRRTFALSSGLQNFGYTAIPVVEKLWPAGAVAVLAVHNLGVELAVWSVGVMLLSGSNTVQWRRLLNGPVFAVVTGLILVATGVDKWIMGPPREAIHMLGSGAFPVAIMLTGAILLDLAKHERPSWKVVLGGALVRLVLSPLLILCAAKFLPIAVELKQVLVVQAAMPAAMTPILLARLYGGRAGIAVQVVVATTLLSLLTIPWIITWGCQWIGLKPGLN
ncbi:MAG: AEC family transporter [Luteolibacter sp.]